MLGKLNLHEFALGGTNAVTDFGPVRNPWALDHHPGGSSGGTSMPSQRIHECFKHWLACCDKFGNILGGSH